MVLYEVTMYQMAQNLHILAKMIKILMGQVKKVTASGNIVTPKRASLNPEKVEQMIVIKCNMQLLRQFGRKIV